MFQELIGSFGLNLWDCHVSDIDIDIVTIAELKPEFFGLECGFRR